MTKSIRNAMNASPRADCGQALIEGTAALVLLTIATCLLIGFLVNVFFVTQWSAKANLVASEAAKAISAEKYWLGMTRPDYDVQEGSQKARAVAQTLCKSLGLPKPGSFKFEEKSDDSGDYNSVTFRISGLSLPINYSGIFPEMLSVQAKGVSFQPRQNCYAAIQMNAPAEQPGTYDVVYLPVYGFFRGYGTNSNFYDVSNGYQTIGPLPGGFGKVGAVHPKYFRGLPLPAPVQWDPRLVASDTKRSVLAGLAR